MVVKPWSTREKSCYLIQIVYIGHLIKILLKWVNWVNYVKVLVWLVKLVKLPLRIDKSVEPVAQRLRSIAWPQISFLASSLSPLLLATVSPSLSPPAHYASPISCTAVTDRACSHICNFACMFPLFGPLIQESLPNLPSFLFHRLSLSFSTDACTNFSIAWVDNIWTSPSQIQWH